GKTQPRAHYRRARTTTDQRGSRDTLDAEPHNEREAKSGRQVHQIEQRTAADLHVVWNGAHRLRHQEKAHSTNAATAAPVRKPERNTATKRPESTSTTPSPVKGRAACLGDAGRGRGPVGS